jgi:DNA-binding NarL/FixJ family response regulator
VRLGGAALALRQTVGHSPPARVGLDDPLELARRHLGTATAEALLADGVAMSADEAVRLATGSGGELRGDGALLAVPAQPAASLSSGAPLTAREREIAALIARGLSNRGIADELVISPATAARHVANIFTKLGFSSRAQVAAWAVQHQSRDVD